MSKFVDSIYKIHNNPFILAPLIIAFYKNLDPTPQNILLAYLILPLVLNEESRNNLKNAKTTSSLHTLSAKNENFFGLPERVQRYKKMTNKCIQHSINNGWIKIKEDLSVDVLIDKINGNEELKDSFKASLNLYKIFKDLDAVTIYRLLGVKEL